MRDVGVNVIRFHYETVQGARVGAQGAAMGRQLYLKSIRYTAASPASGHPEDPAYEVRLLRDADITPAPTPRRDVVVDARGGFLQVTSDLLRRIEIWYGAPNADESPRTYNILSRAWNLHYVEGEFGKSLLKSVDQVGSDGAVLAYLRRLLVDGGPTATALFGSLYATTVASLADLEAAGVLRPTADGSMPVIANAESPTSTLAVANVSAARTSGSARTAATACSGTVPCAAPRRM